MSSGPVEPTFAGALEEFGFDVAEEIIAAAAPSERQGLEDRLRVARQSALDRARRLATEIQEISGRHDHRRLHAIAADPATERLLALLPDVNRRQSEILLGVGRRWGRRQTQANRRRLREARTAFERFDVDLARGLLARLEPGFLGAAEIAERDELLLAVTSRAMEIEQLSGAAEQIVADERPPRRRWWRRR